ncbi:phage holin family protein [Leucobacter japonicus]|uniref:phage holin family protein n=1 Tax=Leucobacter japonicus TaxID=1461259 RepID=UPI0006A7AC14|nr:phage holin family protein [Leucobacter japonicus]
MRSVIRVLVNAFALWLTTLIVGGPGNHGVWVESPGDTVLREFGTQPLSDMTVDDPNAPLIRIITLVLIALVFGLVNGTLGRVVRFVSIPLYIITIGLFGLIVNGVMFWVVAWLSDLAGFGLRLGGFWWGVLAALVLTILSGILNGLLGTSKKKDR